MISFDGKFQPRVFVSEVVGAVDEAGLVHRAHEHLQPDDRVDDDHEDDEQGDLDEGQQRHHDRIEHNLDGGDFLVLPRQNYTQ